MGALRGEHWRRGDDARTKDTPVERIEALAAHVRELDEQPRPRRADVVGDDSKRIDRLDDRIEVLVQRVETLSEIARSASSGVVARERELAAIRTELSDARASVDSALSDLRRLDRAPLEAIQRRVAVLSDDVAVLQQGGDRVRERLDSLVATSDGARATLTAHERTVGQLVAEVDAVTARMDTVVAVVRQAVESLLAQVQTSTEPVSSTHAVDSFVLRQQELADAQRRLEERLDELARKLDGHDSRPRLVAWDTGEADHGSHNDTSDADDTGGPVASFGGGR